MFVERSQWKPNELRQGDVLAGVPFPYASLLQQQLIGELTPKKHLDFPAIVAKMHGISAGSQEASFFTGQAPMKLSFCAVLTQCCELVPNTKGKINFVQTISVCRLTTLTAAMKNDPDKLLAIRSNSDPRKAGGYKNYFFYGAGLELGPEELMADFSQTACIPSREFPDAMASKVLQLDDRSRMKFKIKLGVFNAKPTDEEVAANIHEDPWVET